MNQPMNLTADQWKALAQGQEVRVTVADFGVEWVVIRADVYDRAKQSPPAFKPVDTYAAADEVMAEDWNDPKMAEYDDYESRRPCL